MERIVKGIEKCLLSEIIATILSINGRPLWTTKHTSIIDNGREDDNGHYR